jgi:hypothetical protein
MKSIIIMQACTWVYRFTLQLTIRYLPSDGPLFRIELPLYLDSVSLERNDICFFIKLLPTNLNVRFREHIHKYIIALLNVC